MHEWITSEDKLLEVSRHRRKTNGGRQKPACEATDQLVDQWIRERHQARDRVSRNMVMAEAKRIHRMRPNGDPTFVASAGWLQRFIARNKISLQRRTTIAQCIPSELADKVLSYITHIRHLRETNKYHAKDI